MLLGVIPHQLGNVHGDVIIHQQHHAGIKIVQRLDDLVRRLPAAGNLPDRPDFHGAVTIGNGYGYGGQAAVGAHLIVDAFHGIRADGVNLRGILHRHGHAAFHGIRGIVRHVDHAAFAAGLNHFLQRLHQIQIVGGNGHLRMGILPLFQVGRHGRIPAVHPAAAGEQQTERQQRQKLMSHADSPSSRVRVYRDCLE